MSVYLRIANTPNSDIEAATGAPNACWVLMGFRPSCGVSYSSGSSGRVSAVQRHKVVHLQLSVLLLSSHFRPIQYLDCENNCERDLVRYILFPHERSERGAETSFASAKPVVSMVNRALCSRGVHTNTWRCTYQLWLYNEQQ